MAIELNPDGWSKQLLGYTLDGNYNYSTDPCTDDSYWTYKYRSSTYYNWYTKSYWSQWTLARKFKNLTNNIIVLKTMTFNAAPAHSNGKYATVDTTDDDGNHFKYIFSGHGCKFYCDVFYEGKPNYNASTKLYSPDYISSGGTLKRIYKTNCHVVVDGVTYLGETDVSKGGSWGTTKFGQHSSYQTAKDQYGTTLGMQKITLTFSDEIRIEPGQAVFLVISCPQSGWTSSGWNEGGTAVEATAGSWDSIVEPVQTDYIWVRTSTGWEKSKIAYQATSNGWIAMKE